MEEQRDPPAPRNQIDLGAVNTIPGFRYLPRQDSYHRKHRQYEFYTSMDGTPGAPRRHRHLPEYEAKKEILSPQERPVSSACARSRKSIIGLPPTSPN